MASYTIILKNRREFNAVLAGLRELQRTDDTSRYSPIHEILTDGGCSPISGSEIDDLCERINCMSEVSS